MPGPSILHQILEISRGAGFTAVAVAFYDYETASHFSYQGDRSFHAASTIKVAILLALFKAAEEGRVRLTDRLHVRNRFFSIVDGSVFKVDSGSDGEADVYKQIGRAMRLADLAHAMITRSSNLATNLLLDHLGLDYVRGVLAQVGIEGIKIQRGVEDKLAFKQDLNNETNAEGLVRCFRLLCETGPITEESRQQMIDILLAQKFNAMIPAKLPSEAKVAHKTGEISTACHDAGIVFLPNRKPYVLAILTEIPPGVETRQKPVAEISRLVYEYLNGDPPKS